MAAASHRRVDGDPATLITYNRDCAGHGTRDDARRKHDGAGIDGVVIEPHLPRLDRPDSGGDLEVNSALLEHARGRGRQLLVDLWQNPRTRLEQLKANLMAPDARIEAQHVVGKRGQLADQFDADEATADHDNRQTLAPLRRARSGVGAFE